MKIKPEHYDTIREAVQTADAEYPSIRASYEAGEISAKRFRWDLLMAARMSPWVCDNIYPYANDDHIDTALRRATGTPKT